MRPHEQDQPTRTLDRFAWRPVHLTDGPWLRPSGWVYLARYRAVERFEPDYAGLSAGNWMPVSARPLA